MGQSTFSGPMKIGNRGDEGAVVLEKRATHTQNSTTAVDTTITIPSGAVIIDVFFDVHTAWNSAVSATGSIGIASAGTEYGGSVDLKTATRGRPTFTVAQLAAMAAPASTDVVFTSTISGATSAGFAHCVVIYKMT